MVYGLVTLATYTPLPPPLLPTASGTIPGCYLHENPGKYTKVCRYLANQYGISTDQPFAWNPSLQTSALVLCHRATVTVFCKKAPSDDITTYCYPEMNTTEAGTASSCNCFSYVMLDDAYNDYEITMSELLAWNFWLTGNCDTALYANLEESATRAVCIGTSTASPAPTALPEARTHTTAFRAKFD
ncbi:hypothetical protein CNMCM6805_006898 [Aspergillus fumigatiaffinis]|uniref:LysM domain-containing protein n=1 Tax=Aspergillus fumigatiaffinis TaxID=340414 RepID=A0A8H4H797_9EURO|nr:hypothetical protein CNMCM6805_006898 [Aspergillus fumigatiaffinis]